MDKNVREGNLARKEGIPSHSNVRYKNPSHGINTLLDEYKQLMESDQKVIESLLKMVMLSGKQGFALSGHRDDVINWEDEERSSNEGNFVQLVRFRAETDPILANHLAKSPRNVRYTSNMIQNELVSVNGNSIRNDIINEVKRVRFFLSSLMRSLMLLTENYL